MKPDASHQKNVSIIGMACIFPKAPDLAAFWDNIRNAVDAISDAPPARVDPVYYDPASTAGDRVYAHRGGFIDEYATFDAVGAGIMPRAAEGAEPEQLLTLEIARAALADAGYESRPFAHDRTSIILGRGNYLGPGLTRLINHVRVSEQLNMALRRLLPGLDEATLAQVKQDFQRDSAVYGPDTAIGLVPNLVASRTANRLDLGGSAYTVDAACASTLLAVDQACRELRGGVADMVLAGGVHLCQDPSFWSVFAQLGALSRSQSIRPFDRKADGLLIGEGIGILVLKREADALRDGDRVYATIRGTGISSDGRDTSIMSPRPQGQLLALTRAWEDSGLDPATVGLIEAHGTGTHTGDAAELETLGVFFGPPGKGAARAGLGSIKSMIGHAMPAAGAAALIKAALAAYHGVLPPTLHCDEPNPDVERTRFRLLTKAEPWEAPVRRAGVNAFGFGGINAHIVLEATGAPAPSPQAPLRGEIEPALVLAAGSQAELLERLDAGGEGGSGEGEWRLAVFNPTPQRLSTARAAVAKGQRRMGRDAIYFAPGGLLVGGGKLALLFPGFEAVFEPRLEDVAREFGVPLREFDSRENAGRAAAAIQTNALFFHVLTEVGVAPDALAGHSIGEWSAMAAAGMFDVEDAVALLNSVDPSYFDFPDAGYLAVGASAEVAASVLDGVDGVVVSHDNCPHQSILCGPMEGLSAAQRALAGKGVLSEMLPFRSGFHAPLFTGFVDAYQTQLSRLKIRQPRTPLWSATTRAPYPKTAPKVRALFREHLVRAVDFQGVVRAMYDDGVRVFVQAGVGSLPAFVDDTLQDQEHASVSLNSTHRAGMDQLRRACAMLWVEGANVDLQRLGLSKPARPAQERMQLRLGVPLVDLTVPPLTLSVAPAAATTQQEAAVAGMGDNQEDPSPVYTEELAFSVAEYPDLVDHCLIPQPAGWPVLEDRAPTVPMTMSVQLLMEIAGRAVPGKRPVGVEQVFASDWLTVEPPVKATAKAERQGEDRVRVSIAPYVEGLVVLGDEYPARPASEALVLQDERPPPLTADMVYRDGWLFHGPAYQGIVSLDAMGSNGMLATLRALPARGALLDVAGQVAGLWIMLATETDRLAMPVRIGRVEFYGPHPTPGELVQCEVEVTSVGTREVRANIHLAVEGQAYCRITAWEDWRFQTGNGIFRILRHPHRHLLAEPRGVRAVLLRNFGWNSATVEYLANRFLSAAERRDGKTRPEQRRYAEWLGGRIAAKDAVRRFLFEKGHSGVYPVEITVRSDDEGRPSASGPFTEDLRISISHKDAYAAAIAVEGVDPGIDIEKIEPRGKDFIALACTPQEVALLPAESDEWLTRLWCAKECAGKALGTGLAGDARRLILTEIDGTRLRVEGRWIETQKFGEYVLAWTVQ